MNKIELIQNLINDVKSLPRRDENQLDALRRRAEMIIRKIFENSKEYIQDLNSIYFRPGYGYPGMPDTVYDEAWISGKNRLLNLLNTILEELQLFGTSQETPSSQKEASKISNQIFIVHGHDEEMKAVVARTIQKLGLEPIILHEKPNKGRTIIEKFTDYSDVSFAIVLLSPDDLAFSKNKSPKDAKSRARQNVVLELGFFLGKIGRERVVTLYKNEQNIEIPSDYKGVLYVPYDNPTGQWRFDLVKELKSCGYDVDANKLL